MVFRFYEVTGLHGIVGAVDGTLINIHSTKYDENYPEHIFVDKDNNHSLNTMIVSINIVFCTVIIQKYIYYNVVEKHKYYYIFEDSI
jgi:hypothetical protein